MKYLKFIILVAILYVMISLFVRIAFSGHKLDKYDKYEGKIAVGDVFHDETEDPFNGQHFAKVKAIKSGYIQYNVIISGEVRTGLDWSDKEDWFRYMYPIKQK